MRDADGRLLTGDFDHDRTPDVGAMIERNQEEARIMERLKAATISLRDTGLAHQKAQAEYRDALQAFNKFVAPSPQEP